MCFITFCVWRKLIRRYYLFTRELENIESVVMYCKAVKDAISNAYDIRFSWHLWHYKSSCNAQNICTLYKLFSFNDDKKTRKLSTSRIEIQTGLKDIKPYDIKRYWERFIFQCLPCINGKKKVLAYTYYLQNYLNVLSFQEVT